MMTIKKGKKRREGSDEKGAVLAIVLFLTTAAMLMGLFVTEQSVIELFIATNDVDGKRAFYHAESGLETGREFLEQNIACPAGNFKVGKQSFDENIWLSDEIFWNKNENAKFNRREIKENASIRFIDSDTYIAYTYVRSLAAGSAAPQGEGYESAGASAAKSLFLTYNIYSECLGRPNTDAVLMVQYRHLSGQEEDCHF
ncbi:MAG: hypothetical protein GY859_13665 [Desulfobacterales bacterium]|nr:hypothetical protein [Desulfobacterales bacterium]